MRVRLVRSEEDILSHRNLDSAPAREEEEDIIIMNNNEEAV